jgi:hypothetical protein
MQEGFHSVCDNSLRQCVVATRFLEISPTAPNITTIYHICFDPVTLLQLRGLLLARCVEEAYFSGSLVDSLFKGVTLAAYGALRLQDSRWR